MSTLYQIGENMPPLNLTLKSYKNSTICYNEKNTERSLKLQFETLAKNYNVEWLNSPECKHDGNILKIIQYCTIV